MKYIKLFEDYKITKIPINFGGNYRYCDGIKYKLGKEENTYQVNINNVFHTVENTFYQEQIENYKEYILNGGSIETFPVEIVKKASRIKEMMEWLDEPENFDAKYDILHKTFLYSIDNLVDIFNKEEFPEYSRINKYAATINDLFYGWGEINRTKEENELFELLKIVYNYFNEEVEYYLLDFNHRFAAVKELGKKEVLVEEMI